MRNPPMPFLKKSFVPIKAFLLLNDMKCVGRILGAWKLLSMKKIWWAMCNTCPATFILTETG